MTASPGGAQSLDRVPAAVYEARARIRTALSDALVPLGWDPASGTSPDGRHVVTVDLAKWHTGPRPRLAVALEPDPDDPYALAGYVVLAFVDDAAQALDFLRAARILPAADPVSSPEGRTA